MANATGRTVPCSTHPERPAVIRCGQCRKPICAQCVVSTIQGKFCSRECSDKSASSRAAAAAQAESAATPAENMTRRVANTFETVKRWVFTAVKFTIWTIVIIVGLWAVNRFFFKIPVIGDVIFNPGVATKAPDTGGKPAGNAPAEAPAANSAGTSAVQDWSSNKLNAALEEFYSYIPIFREAGFDVSQISVEVGIIPKLDATFSQIKVLTPEEQQAVLKTQEKKYVLCFLLRSLFGVHNMKLSRFSLSSVTMSLSIPPHTILSLEVKTEEPKPAEAGAAPAPDASGKPKEPAPDASGKPKEPASDTGGKPKGPAHGK